MSLLTEIPPKEVRNMEAKKELEPSKENARKARARKTTLARKTVLRHAFVTFRILSDGSSRP